MRKTANLNPRPAGFGNCAACVYRESGPTDVCLSCALERIGPRAARRCEVCGQAITGEGRCRNFWCSRPDRCFDHAWAILQKGGPIERAIRRFKYQGKAGWGAIFGRILLGYLAQHEETMRGFDHIIPAPSYTGPWARRSWNHAARVLKEAASQAGGDRWPFYLAVPNLIEKRVETDAMVSARAVERQAIARTQVRDALEVTDPRLVEGRRILVFDDVLTGGSTIQEIARALKTAGATDVSAVVLARQPWISVATGNDLRDRAYGSAR
jgi:predicted amidophosphoribosyltransferase